MQRDDVIGSCWVDGWVLHWCEDRTVQIDVITNGRERWAVCERCGKRWRLSNVTVEDYTEEMAK